MALPALTVMASMNWSLQLLVPTNRARLVFFISLSTVFCQRTEDKWRLHRMFQPVHWVFFMQYHFIKPFNHYCFSSQKTALSQFQAKKVTDQNLSNILGEILRPIKPSYHNKILLQTSFVLFMCITSTFQQYVSDNMLIQFLYDAYHTDFTCMVRKNNLCYFRMGKVMWSFTSVNSSSTLLLLQRAT